MICFGDAAAYRVYVCILYHLQGSRSTAVDVFPFGFLVINVCNHGEHYETPCIKKDIM